MPIVIQLNPLPRA